MMEVCTIWVRLNVTVTGGSFSKQMTLNVDLDLWKVNSDIWLRCLTSVPNFIGLLLSKSEKYHKHYEQTNQPTNLTDTIPPAEVMMIMHAHMTAPIGDYLLQQLSCKKGERLFTLVTPLRTLCSLTFLFNVACIVVVILYVQYLQRCTKCQNTIRSTCTQTTNNQNQ